MKVQFVVGRCYPIVEVWRHPMRYRSFGIIILSERSFATYFSYSYSDYIIPDNKIIAIDRRILLMGKFRAGVVDFSAHPGNIKFCRIFPV